MSVVVYKHGLMGADSRAYSGSNHPMGDKLKIHRLPDGTLLGIVSNSIGMPEAFRDWVIGGENREDFMPGDPSFSAIKVTPSGHVYLYDDSYTPSGPLTGDFFTIGSGRKYAYGALLMGASVTKAVEVAIQCDCWCGGHVERLELHP